MAVMLVVGASSFTPSQKHYTVKVKNALNTEYFEVSAGPGLGAYEVVLYITRTGPNAGEGYVEFDVDIMYDYNPSHVQTHHVVMDNYQTYFQQARWASYVVGTDATPVGDVYNVVYY
jgi:hypothetical protein